MRVSGVDQICDPLKFGECLLRRHIELLLGVVLADLLIVQGLRNGICLWLRDRCSSIIHRVVELLRPTHHQCLVHLGVFEDERLLLLVGPHLRERLLRDFS